MYVLESDLKCSGILLPAMSALRNKGFMGFGCSLQTFVNHHGSSYMVLFFFPKIGPDLSRKVICFVLKPGPLCPGTWSVLS